MIDSERDQTILIPRSDKLPGFTTITRTVRSIDHFGRAKPRGIVQLNAEEWIVARHWSYPILGTADDGWVLEITVEDACKGGHKSLKYRNYLERTGQIHIQLGK